MAIRESKADRVFLYVLYAVLCIILLLIVYPVVYIVSSSFSSSSAVMDGKVWLWPVHPTLFGYEAAFAYSTIWTGYLNSVIYAAGGSALSVVLTIMLAYPLSRPEFYGRNVWIVALLFAMIFNGGLIPYYLVVKSLGMLNTRWSIIVPSGLNIFSVIVAKTFFQSSVSRDLHDAAEMDGCSDIRFLLQIVVPLSKPIIAVVLLWSAVFQWNSYFQALIFLDSTRLLPLQIVLRNILVLGQASTSQMSLSPEALKYFEAMRTLLKYSVIVIASVPMLMMYPLVQRYFVKGIMIGSVKE